MAITTGEMIVNIDHGLRG